jgi:peptidoglycan/LPS O-acetylase OafA/YrhL
MTRPRLHSSHPKYRPDIDGLRALAVLSVVAFHAFPAWVKGGFIGVDIFFVISGFLISTIVFENLDNRTFSFTEFYARRIIRIFPALLLVLVASYAFGWFALLPDEYKQLGKHIAAGAGFVANLALQSEVNYFDNSAETKPLLHLWSLGVEEQFYIVWPLALWFAWKRHWNRLILTILVATVSFALNIEGTGENSLTTFYSPQARFWELLCGGVLAWFALYKRDFAANENPRAASSELGEAVCRENWEAAARRLPNAISFLGCLILAYGFMRVDKTMSFPGKWAILPVLGSVLIILAGPNAWINRKVLSNGISVWFGLISFPLYLWHWPLLSFARIVEGETPSWSIRVATVLLSIILAWLTFKLVESPVRLIRHQKVKATILVILMSLVGCVGYATYERNGIESRVAEFARISKAAGEWQYPGQLVSFRFDGRRFLRQSSGSQDITLFVGDSNVEQFYARADELISSRPSEVNSVVFVTGGGCLAVPNSPYIDSHRHCNNLMESAYKYAVGSQNVKRVVIGAQWNGYLSHGWALDGNFAIGSRNYLEALDRLSDYILELVKNGKSVFLILNIPTGDMLDPKFMIGRGLEFFPSFFYLREGGVSRKSISERYGKIQDDLKKVAELNGAKVVSPMDFLCDSLVCPSIDDDGEPIYKDSSHLRPSYVRRKARFIDDLVISQ